MRIEEGKREGKVGADTVPVNLDDGVVREDGDEATVVVWISAACEEVKDKTVDGKTVEAVVSDIVLFCVEATGELMGTRED